MTDKTDAFLREGVARYADACATMAHFQIELERLLLTVLQGRSDWGRMTLRKGSRFKPGRSTSIRTPPHWIEATAHGSVDGTNVVVEVGLWWGLPEAQAPAVAFATFFSGPPEIQKFSYVPEDSRFRAFEYADRMHVAVTVDATSDLAASAADVLAELLRATSIVSATAA